MGTIVQKYGGSSVSTPAKLKEVARRVVDTRAQGHDVVVVVSAMGDTTNQLLSLAKEVSPQPHRRELDMLLTVGERISMSLLSMAIQDLGVPSVSFTGSQSGIITTDTHTNARIIKVRPTRIRNALALDQVVIVAGFQGVSERLEITSLGRGGTDTTAVALAAALEADYVEICSDVDGVYSADPRIVETAKRVPEMSYDEMQLLADHGAKVLNAEAVEWARRSGIEVRCVATKDETRTGTAIRQRLDDSPEHHHPQCSAVTHHPGLLKVCGSGSIPPKLFEVLRESGVGDTALQRVSVTHSSTEVWCAWLPLLNVHQEEQLRECLAGLDGVELDEGWSWVTLVGRSMLSMSLREGEVEYGLPELIQQKVKGLGIDVHLVSCSPSALRWALMLDDAPRVVKMIHQLVIDHG